MLSERTTMVTSWEALDWVVFLFALVSWLGLWILGFTVRDPDNRFRCFSVGSLLFYVVLGKLLVVMGLGWGWATAIWFIGLWIVGIIGGTAESASTQ
jgi:hypothetical protein